ncbi:O-antigen polymerase [Fibrella sp. ES10-3-2-2]|nr:hypothetical protein A6C57_05915 [Fibrella sp. ES10-3-2-2]
MNLNIVRNPFYCYIFGFGLCLLVYSWGWSDLYPFLSWELILFFIITFSISILLGKRFDGSLKYRKIGIDPNNKIIFFTIWAGFLLEFIYNRGVPLFLLIKDPYYNYQVFGIPTFHVVLATISPFYAVYLFHQYLSNKTKIELIMFLSLFLPGILIVSRGATVTLATSCIILYFQQKDFINLKKIVNFSIGLIFFLYMFGLIGFIRSFKDQEEYFLDISQATTSFKDSYVPKEFFWFYLYASSPIANFQNVTLTAKKHNYDVPKYINRELLPDFISKRIVDPMSDIDIVNRMNYSIASFLTAGTIFYDSYVRMGWVGVGLTALYFFFLCAFYIAILRKESVYFITGVTIISTMSIYNVFDNMISFAGLSFQLVYPFFFQFLKKYKFILNK